VRAERFLTERFGGSMFLQLLVEADIRDPLVLDEIARLEDHTAAIAGVSNVRSVTEVLRLVNRACWATTSCRGGRSRSCRWRPWPAPTRRRRCW